MKKIDKEGSPEWFQTWKQNFKNVHGREAHYKRDFSSDDDEEEYSNEDIRDFIDYYSNKDDGRYVPYCMAIVDCLKECFTE